MRLFDHALMADVPVKVLDGDQTWRVLGAYVKPELWISPSRVKKQPHDQRPASTSRRTPSSRARTRATARRASTSRTIRERVVGEQPTSARPLCSAADRDLESIVLELDGEYADRLVDLSSARPDPGDDVAQARSPGLVRAKRSESVGIVESNDRERTRVMRDNRARAFPHDRSHGCVLDAGGDRWA